MEYKDYYKTLGVERTANEDAIKQAYRKLARKYHPDVSKEKNAEEKFKDVQEAYEVLKDKEKRAAYDQLGSNWKSGQDFRPPPGWQDSHTRFYTSEDLGGFGDDLGGFSDFFTNLFGGARRGGFNREGGGGFGRDAYEGAFQQRGADQHAKVNVSLEDAYHGSTKTIQLQVPEVGERGSVGYKTQTLKITIPPGAYQGQQLRLSGKGAPGFGGGPAGDLYLELHIESNARFSLQGNDIYLTLPIAPWEAALGAEIKVPTLGGLVGLKLPPNSQSGQKLRLKGRGMPHKTAKGDQYVILQILIPEPTSDADRELYNKMRETMPFNPRKDWPS